MITCRKCGTDFKTWAMIDGKPRNFRNRKYCLTCSPFGSRNTRRIEIEIDETCQFCDKKFQTDDMNNGRTCSSCRTRIARRRKKMFFVNAFGGKCCECGYNKSMNALEFHHREGLYKTVDPSDAVTKWGRERAMIELKKCDLVCSNCHRERHEATNETTQRIDAFISSELINH